MCVGYVFLGLAGLYRPEGNVLQYSVPLPRGKNPFGYLDCDCGCNVEGRNRVGYFE